MSLTLPQRVPKLGFYYHYKHDATGPVNNYAYEVVGVGFHTEKQEHFVFYRPLYEASVFEASQILKTPCFDARPLEMWLGNVEKDGRTRPRFEIITDQGVILQLEIIRHEMYP